MPSIITTTNDLLPNFRINNIIVGQLNTTNSISDTLLDSSNLYVNINFDIIQLLSELDNIIADQEYYRFVKFNVEILDQNTTLSFQTFYLDDVVFQEVVNKEIYFENINSTFLNLKISAILDFEKFSNYFNVKEEQLNIIRNVFGSEKNIIYPILQNSEVVQQFDDFTTSVTQDYRLIDGLTSYRPEIIIYQNDDNYLNDIMYITNNNENYFCFITFNYKKFLLNNSFIVVDAFSDYEIDLEISDNSGIVDNIKLTNDSFESLLGNSVLQSKNTDYVVFSFVNSIIEEPDNIVENFKIKLINNDKTLLRFKNIFDNTGVYYNILNNYLQIKNTILLANNFDKPDVKPFYLDLKNNLFTNEFRNFYNEQILFFNEFNINLKIDDYIDNFFNQIFNKFTRTSVTLDQITNLKNILNINTSSFNTWLRAFQVFDQVFNSIETLLADSDVIPFYTYEKEYLNIKITKSNSFYSLTEKYNYDLYPSLLISDIQQSFDNGLVYANYFTDDNETIKIESTVPTDSKLFNSIFAYSNVKKLFGSPSFSRSNILSFNNLEDYGVSVDTVKLIGNTNTFKNKTTDYSVSSEARKTSIANTSFKTRDLNNLTTSELTTIKVKNNLFASILKGSNVEDNVNKDFIAPTYKLHNFNSGSWEEITDVTQIKENSLLKAELQSSPEILLISGVEDEKINFIDTYFITRTK